MRPGETTALHKILALKKRLCIIQGGSSAGKTYAILLILIDRAQIDKGKVISVVSESMPHLRKGAIRDFKNIMMTYGYWNENRWNETNSVYTFETNSIIEFFSVDTSDKVRGPRRNVLFINEANNVDFDTYNQLSLRTDEDVYLDYNPVSEYWVHTEIIPSKEHDFIILTYKDNEQLSPAIIQEIESHKGETNFWKVYGLGELGTAEGKIYTNWKIIDEVPHEARLEGYGLDFGYTNDPTAIVAIYYYNGGYIVDEIVFQKGMSNREIADTLKNQKQALVVADSAEPKSIDEIKSYGINIIPTFKGKDSVRQGIGVVQQQQVSVTKPSTNVIKEFRNYLWKVDRDGKVLNEPEHEFSHSMDAVRYRMSALIPILRRKEYLESLPILHYEKQKNPAI